MNNTFHGPNGSCDATDGHTELTCKRGKAHHLSVTKFEKMLYFLTLFPQLVM